MLAESPLRDSKQVWGGLSSVEARILGLNCVALDLIFWAKTLKTQGGRSWVSKAESLQASRSGTHRDGSAQEGFLEELTRRREQGGPFWTLAPALLEGPSGTWRGAC